MVVAPNTGELMLLARYRLERGISAAVVFFVGLLGCKELTGSPGLPAGTPDPSVYQNATGAVGMRNAALLTFEQALAPYVRESGLLTDEMEDGNTGASLGILSATTGVQDALDERILPEGIVFDNEYASLQNARAFITQARGALAAYDTAKADTATASLLRGELYAFEGYTEILLADLYCSGVPLSYLVFQGDFQYEPGSTTAQVYRAAIAKLDSAERFGHGSDSVTYLAAVLQGRANLALGNYPAAADDVIHVPTNFVYQVAAQWVTSTGGVSLNVLNGSGNNGTVAGGYTVSDSEGKNGLPYRLSGDPRTATVGVAVNSTIGDSLYFPTKYSAALSGVGYSPFALASGVEARLIEAETQLASAPASGQWLATLNALRTNVSNLILMSNQTYTANTPLLSLTDPGATLTGVDAMVARLRLLYRERAYWLFLDGHREGDLRRILRKYHTYGVFSDQSLVYPTGKYLAPGTGFYGSDVTVPIPPAESANPDFTGCLDRNP